LTLPGWRKGSPIGRPVAASHSRAVPSPEAEASRVPSGLKASAQIGPV
jgi:hypothetical protein